MKAGKGYQDMQAVSLPSKWDIVVLDSDYDDKGGFLRKNGIELWRLPIPAQ